MIQASHPKLPIKADSKGNLYGKYGLRKLNLRKDGYLQVSINRSSYLAHRIVAECFIENKKNLPKINHKDGVKTNNCIENLEWVTQRENIIHARDILGVKYNLKKRDAFNAKIKNEQVDYAKRMFNFGLSKRQIAEVLGVEEHTIARVLNGN